MTGKLFAAALAIGALGILPARADWICVNGPCYLFVPGLGRTSVSNTHTSGSDTHADVQINGGHADRWGFQQDGQRIWIRGGQPVGCEEYEIKTGGFGPCHDPTPTPQPFAPAR